MNYQYSIQEVEAAKPCKYCAVESYEVLSDGVLEKVNCSIGYFIGRFQAEQAISDYKKLREYEMK